MKVPSPKVLNILNAIDQGNAMLNETIRLYKQTHSDCPDCGYDPIRKTSTDPFCDTCDGKGSIIVETYHEIKASVEQEEDFRSEFTNAGKITRNQVYVTLARKEIHNVLNVDTNYDFDDYNQMKAFVEQYSYILWKGAKYSIESFEPGWIEEILYEIGVTLSLIE